MQLQSSYYILMLISIYSLITIAAPIIDNHLFTFNQYNMIDDDPLSQWYNVNVDEQQQPTIDQNTITNNVAQKRNPNIAIGRADGFRPGRR